MKAPIRTLVRPAKVRNAVRRRWFEFDAPRTEISPFETPLALLGSSYGGWLVPDIQYAGWTCYCVGMGADVSFERCLLERGANVRSVEPVEAFVGTALTELGGFAGFGARRAAVALCDGTIRMQKHHEPRSESLSAAGLYESSDVVEVPGRSVPSLMNDFGDQRIDLLKLDVEGLEYELIPTLQLREHGVRVFAAQFHHNGSVGQVRRLVELLREEGYRVAGARSGVKLTFVRTDAAGSPELAAAARQLRLVG